MAVVYLTGAFLSDQIWGPPYMSLSVKEICFYRSNPSDLEIDLHDVTRFMSKKLYHYYSQLAIIYEQ